MKARRHDIVQLVVDVVRDGHVFTAGTEGIVIRWYRRRPRYHPNPLVNTLTWLRTSLRSGPLQHREGYLVYLDPAATGHRKLGVLLSPEEFAPVPPSTIRLNDLQRWHALIGVPQSMKEETVKFLISVPHDEMLNVLQQVFAHKPPYPEEGSYLRNKYFLGIAMSSQEEIWDEPTQTTAERWGDWEIHAVGYLEEEQTLTGSGPHGGFGQYGQCPECAMHVHSNRKDALCPICGTRVYLT